MKEMGHVVCQEVGDSEVSLIWLVRCYVSAVCRLGSSLHLGHEEGQVVCGLFANGEACADEW